MRRASGSLASYPLAQHQLVNSQSTARASATRSTIVIGSRRGQSTLVLGFVNGFVAFLCLALDVLGLAAMESAPVGTLPVGSGAGSRFLGDLDSRFLVALTTPV